MLRVFQSEPYVVAGRPVGPFAMNQYVVICPTSRAAAFIDCGGEPEPFFSFLEGHDANLTHLLLTHGHVDHVAGLALTRRQSDAQVHLHAGERPSYDQATLRGRLFGMNVEPPPTPDVALTDGDTLSVGALTFDVLHTPGHSPGHVCFFERSAGLIFCGDLLFRGSIGRTDLPGSDPAQMGPSLARLLELPDSTVAFPGHMEPTSIGSERADNPFLSLFLEQ